jgi:hypothetical protein
MPQEDDGASELDRPDDLSILKAAEQICLIPMEIKNGSLNAYLVAGLLRDGRLR